MTFDLYRWLLAKAKWDWREGGGHPRHKDRLNGRAEKRRARRETDRETQEMLNQPKGPTT